MIACQLADLLHCLTRPRLAPAQSTGFPVIHVFVEQIVGTSTALMYALTVLNNDRADVDMWFQRTAKCRSYHREDINRWFQRTVECCN